MRAMFDWWQQEGKLVVFFLPKKPKMFAERWCSPRRALEEGEKHPGNTLQKEANVQRNEPQ
jgi:hypothetical protein